MKPIRTAPRQALLALAVLSVSCVVAACGSSSNSSTHASAATATTSSAAGGTASRSSFFACLRSHGVTLPNRPAGGAPPGGGGGGLFGGGGGFRGGGFRSNPKFRAAFQACGGRIRFGAGAGRFRISHTAINNFVTCVRKHGYPQMPSPNFSGKGPVFPASIRTNSKFQAASRSCASMLQAPGAPGTSTTSGGPA